jgi:hypothetical protein
MERINAYAVMRNTATHDAYRAYIREATKAGQPFLLLGLIMSMTTPMLLTFGGLLGHSPEDWKWALGGLIAMMAACGVILGIGLMKIAKFRRDHPIPEEWRQIPRVSWPPPYPGQKPRLP